MPISANYPSSREECACARPFDATQWRHQLLYTACPVNSCSAICLAHGSRRRFGTLGTMSSSPSIASSRIGSGAPPAPPGSEFSGLTGSDKAGNSPTRQWHRISLVSSRFHVDVLNTLFSLYATVQPYYYKSLISCWIHVSILFTTFEPLWNM